jgi:hypothetical protein
MLAHLASRANLGILDYARIGHLLYLSMGLALYRRGVNESDEFRT